MKNIFIDYYSNKLQTLYFETNGSNGYKTFSFYVGEKVPSKVYMTFQTNEGSSLKSALDYCINAFNIDTHKELSYLKNLKIIQINLAYNDTINGLTKMTPDAEMSTWTLQKLEADMYDVTKKAPFLEKLASIRGITLDDLITKVKEKNALYVETVGNITGYRQKLEDAIVKASSIEDIKAVVWDSNNAITPTTKTTKKVSKK